MRTIALVLLTCACATPTQQTPKGGPRGLRADEHLVAARNHDAEAQNDGRWPDMRSATPEAVNIPWTRSWATDDHERAAAVHRSKADELHAAYSDACGPRPLSEVSISPLQRYGIGGWNTQTGVIIYLDPKAGDPDRLLADIKCHRAWMMLSEAAGMDDCPLDLPGIQIDARGDAEGITVSIGVRDTKFVRELHRRAAHELEAGARMRANAAPR